MQAKAEKAELKKLEETVLEIKEQLADENNKQCMLQEQLDQLSSYCKNYFRELERINVSSEAYSKRLNLLVHGLKLESHGANLLAANISCQYHLANISYKTWSQEAIDQRHLFHTRFFLIFLFCSARSCSSL